MKPLDELAGELSLPTTPEGYVNIEEPGVIPRPGGKGFYFLVTDGLVEVAEPGKDFVPGDSDALADVFNALAEKVDNSAEMLSLRDGRIHLAALIKPAPRGPAPLPPAPRAGTRTRIEDVLEDEAPVDLVQDPEVLTQAEQAYRKERLLSDLRRASDAEAKMDILAAFLDRYGFDAFIGLIPHVGDGAVTAVAGIITFWQGVKAGIGVKSGLKIAGFHLADFLAGQVPFLGELADLFIKPNEYAAGQVAHRLRALLDEARARGVPQEEIDEALQGGKDFKDTWYGHMEGLAKIKGHLLKAAGITVKEKPRLEDHGSGHGGSHPPKAPAAGGTSKPPEAKATADLPALAGDFLLYGDILELLPPDRRENLKRKIAQVKWGGCLEANEEKYAKALKELFTEDYEKVMQISDGIRDTFLRHMHEIGITDFSPFSLSQSWSLWDLAKQHYCNKYDRSQSAGYYLGDPLTDHRVQEEISLRHFGWELYQKWQDPVNRSKIEAKMAGSPRRAEILNLFTKAPNSKGTLSSKDLTRLGGLVSAA